MNFSNSSVFQWAILYFVETRVMHFREFYHKICILIEQSNLLFVRTFLGNHVRQIIHENDSKVIDCTRN